MADFPNPAAGQIVSHEFPMKGAKPVKTISVQAGQVGLEHPLYLWVTPIEWKETD